MEKDHDRLVKNFDGKLKYMVVHSRWMEGQCITKLRDAPSQEECYMEPPYIKRILRSQGLLGRVPIVVISDMQKTESLEALRTDPDIGHLVIVPALDEAFRTTNSTVTGDMVLAAYSDAFVGTRASSMAVMIGYFRIALGADPESNYIYVDQSSNAKENVLVCGECIFFCNKSVTPAIC